MQIIFLSPGGQIINDTREIEFQMENRGVDDQDSSDAMQFNLELRNIILREKGIHTTKIFFNGELIGEYKIKVIVGEYHDTDR